MDWWKLFGGTFILIFLAELGDKTQLAALAKTADAPDNSTAKWVVFLAASMALVVSTFIAVFLGHILKQLVPDERYIRLASALLFLVFGFTILYETYASFRQPVPVTVGSAPRATVPSDPGIAGGLALRAALEFEALAVDRYRRVAESAKPELAKLLRTIASEEEGHLRRLQKLPDDQLPAAVKKGGRGSGVSGRNLVVDGDDAKVVAQLIEHEEATAQFYRDLASRTLIGSVRSVLNDLAEEETDHARRLREMI